MLPKTTREFPWGLPFGALCISAGLVQKATLALVKFLPFLAFPALPWVLLGRRQSASIACYLSHCFPHFSRIRHFPRE